MFTEGLPKALCKPFINNLWLMNSELFLVLPSAGGFPKSHLVSSRLDAELCLPRPHWLHSSNGRWPCFTAWEQLSYQICLRRNEVTLTWFLLTTLDQWKPQPEIKGTSHPQCRMCKSEDCLPRITWRIGWRRGLERLWVKITAATRHLHSPEEQDASRALVSCNHRLLTHSKDNTFLSQLKQKSKSYGTSLRMLSKSLP